jgi:hypothetical protein
MCQLRLIRDPCTVVLGRGSEVGSILTDEHEMPFLDIFVEDRSHCQQRNVPYQAENQTDRNDRDDGSLDRQALSGAHKKHPGNPNGSTRPMRVHQNE